MRWLRSFITELRTFAGEESGATAMLFSLSSVFMVGSIAFGIDAANWYRTDSRLQAAVDMATLAASSDRALQGAAAYNGESLTTIVRNELTRNGVPDSLLATLQVNNPPLSGEFVGDNTAVEVIATQEIDVFLAGVVFGGTPEASARAVARTYADGNYCILTLHPSLSGAVTFSGSSAAFLGCGIASNSTAGNAVSASGSSYVSTTVVTAVGGIDDGGNIEAVAAFRPYSNPVINPYADLEVDDADLAGGCDYNNVRAKNGDVLEPGVYCGDLRVNANAGITMAPGTYFMDGGDFNVNANADVYGDGVTIVFTNSDDPTDPGEPTINGSAEMDLSASTAGDYEGILFMRDPRGDEVSSSSSARWQVNGNSSSHYFGVIYAPGVEVYMSGNATLDDGCVQVVSGAVTFTGNFEIEQECDDPSLSRIGAITVTLVE